MVITSVIGTSGKRTRFSRGRGRIKVSVLDLL